MRLEETVSAEFDTDGVSGDAMLATDVVDRLAVPINHSRDAVANPAMSERPTYRGFAHRRHTSISHNTLR